MVTVTRLLSFFSSWIWVDGDDDAAVVPELAFEYGDE